MTIEQLQKAHESGATIEIRYEECGDNDKPWRWREEPNPDWSLDADYYRLAKPTPTSQALRSNSLHSVVGIPNSEEK